MGLDRPASRRQFLQRGAALSAVLGGLPAAVAACGGVKGTEQQSAKESSARAASVRHPKEPIGEWTFTDYPLYMDKKILRSFEKRYGGKVRFLEEVNDNFEFYGKVRQQLADDRSIGRDLLVLADYVVGRFARPGWLEPIDRSNVPNAANLVDHLRTINYDPRREYTLPYQSGANGLGYDITRTGGELRSIKDLFDPRFKGKVTLLSEGYDSASTVLIMQGKDPGKATLDDLLGAIEVIDEANRKGQFRRFTGNDYTTDLTKGNVWVSLAYSGDMIQLQSENPNLRFAYPEEGTILWNDNMMMPKGVEHPYAAETMMNYLYDPEVAARLTRYVNYVSPVRGVREILERTDPKLAEDPLIFPPDDVAAGFHSYPALSPADERAMHEAMAKVTGA
jgi:spermidine/putrescine transport system substrate-binding protein